MVGAANIVSVRFANRFCSVYECRGATVYLYFRRLYCNGQYLGDVPHVNSPGRFVRGCGAIVPLIGLFRRLFCSRCFHVRVTTAVSREVQRVSEDGGAVRREAGRQKDQCQGSNVDRPCDEYCYLRDHKFAHRVQPDGSASVPVLRLPVIHCDVFRLQVVRVTRRGLTVVDGEEGTPAFHRYYPVRNAGNVRLVCGEGGDYGNVVSSVARGMVRAINPMGTVFLPTKVGRFSRFYDLVSL